VKEDADFAIVVTLITEGVLHLGLFSSGRASEDVRSHGNSGVAVEVDLVVGELDVAPPFSAVDSKSSVFGVSSFGGITSDEVGHSLSAGGTEGELRGLRRLEEDLRLAVAVELSSGITGGFDVITLVEVRFADSLDRVSPLLLSLKDLVHGDRSRGGRWCTRGNRHRVLDNRRRSGNLASRFLERLDDCATDDTSANNRKERVNISPRRRQRMTGALGHRAKNAPGSAASGAIHAGMIADGSTGRSEDGASPGSGKLPRRERGSRQEEV